MSQRTVAEPSGPAKPAFRKIKVIMPLKSSLPDVETPKLDVLSYLFPADREPSDRPIWIDSQDPQEFLTPRQLLLWVKRFGLGLDNLGIKRGEAVMILTPNHIFVPVAYLGIVGSGRCFSGANPIYTVEEIAYQIEDISASVLLVHHSLIDHAITAARRVGLSKARIFLFSESPNQDINGVKDWRTILGTVEQGQRWQWPRLSPQQSMTTVATVNYSSGTTGPPKGVCISHYNLIANVEQYSVVRYATQDEREHHPDEKWCGFLPLYHAYGQLHTILMCIRLDVPVYVMKQFVFEDLLRAIQRFKVTRLQVAPPILVMLNKRPETKKYNLSSIQEILCGAAPLRAELQNDIARRFGLTTIQGWGMTEVTCGAIIIPTWERDDGSGSVGRLIPNMEAKLLDDDDKEVNDGQPGELHVRGPNICLGYWRNEQATKDTLLSGGWLKTGDVAIVRNGRFWIVDRKKELIKVNALQVAPAELEAALLEHDDVADAAVVGITLSHDEEYPRAYIVLKDESKGKVTASDIHMWSRKRLAKHKWFVGGVSFIEEVPRLASGKIQRKVLRAWSQRDTPEMERQVRPRL
ncbi:MAG: hypothetical protein M1820_000694 [Bogoriella megaspora]|nr:MAG: hypothetical protein M1820_000694 [Bogoriella megaspora]